MNRTRGRRSTQKNKMLSCLILNGTMSDGGKSWPIQDQLFIKALCCFVEKPFAFSYFSIDASREDGSLGRLVNDCHTSPNCKMKRLTVQGKPHLCLFAIENIQAETEITYDYGDSQWPWRNLVSKTS